MLLDHHGPTKREMRKFSFHLAAKALWQMRVRKRPFVLSHGITSRCNLRCRFCDYWSIGGREMSTPEIKQMLDEAAAFGIGVYNAWTAEPLMREDLPEILTHARSNGLLTSLVTNGRLLAKRAEELDDLDFLSVSLDGIKSYRDLRGCDPDDVVRGINKALSCGHEILINCVISSKNLDELEEMVRLAQDLGVWISFEPINEFPEMDKTVWDDIGIRNIPKYRMALDRLIEMKSEGAPIINSQTYLRMIQSLKPDFRCHAPEIILHVSSDGNVSTCRVSRQSLGNVSEGISRVWTESRARRERVARECGGCLFFGYVENSLLYDMVPEVMAHYEWM